MDHWIMYNSNQSLYALYIPIANGLSCTHLFDMIEATLLSWLLNASLT